MITQGDGSPPCPLKGARAPTGAAGGVRGGGSAAMAAVPNAEGGSVRAKSITLTKRQNRIWPLLIFLGFPSQAERFGAVRKYSEFCSDSAS